MLRSAEPKMKNVTDHEIYARALADLGRWETRTAEVAADLEEIEAEFQPGNHPSREADLATVLSGESLPEPGNVAELRIQRYLSMRRTAEILTRSEGSLRELLEIAREKSRAAEVAAHKNQTDQLAKDFADALDRLAEVCQREDQFRRQLIQQGYSRSEPAFTVSRAINRTALMEIFGAGSD